MGGIKLKPIQHRSSLYILIPMELAKLIDATKDTEFILTLKQGKKPLLIYEVKKK